MKKGVKLGSNGSFKLAYFQGIYSTQTAGVNINKNAGKLNSYLSYQFTNRNNYEELNSDRQIRTDSSLLAQRAYTTYPSLNNYFGGGLDFELTKKFNIGYDLRINQSSSKSHALNSNDVFKDPASTLLARSESNTNNSNHSLYIGNNFSSKYKFDSTGSEWTVEVDYNYYNYKNAQDYYNRYDFPVRPGVSGDGSTRNEKYLRFPDRPRLQIPKSLTLETGFKATISHSRNSTVYLPTQEQPGDTLTISKPILSPTTKRSRRPTYRHPRPLGLPEAGPSVGNDPYPGRSDRTERHQPLDQPDRPLPYVYLSRKLFKLFGVQLWAMPSTAEASSGLLRIAQPLSEIHRPFIYLMWESAIISPVHHQLRVECILRQHTWYWPWDQSYQDIFSNVTY
ncbi:MAG: hypothetical protein IPI66_07235 [Chitinophagaceae bacterium]|nr:hypothetical protein [Chitinophagaceae bacterium]